MKKLILLLIIVGIAQNAKAGLEIQQITVSPLNTTDLNVHIIVADGYYFENYTHNYEIVNSTITLNICYLPYLLPVGTFKENDFVLSNVNVNVMDYTLVVNVNYRRWDGSNYNCSSPIGSDSDTLVFTTPLNAAVSLQNEDFNYVSNDLILFPNPTKGTLYFNSELTSFLKSVKVFDNVGRLTSVAINFADNSIDLKQLKDGIYLVEFISEKESIFKKIIVKK